VVFAAAAVMLAIVGMYGVIALSVDQRRRELGVRMALGARGSDVLRLVLGEGARIGAVGIVAGVAGALAASRVLGALLYGTTATSPVVYAITAVGIAVATLSATYIPARRATRLDPASALRRD
jgi:ABC-type antimicrobial peptide transport system permease subunit